ncbi:MAG TPA: histidine kinase [Burkholderiaceae bacterium]|nr:histidine kinase [Burkholderiaceae bacterium]
MSAWSRSTLLRVSLVLGLIALLAIGVVLAAAVFTERSAGKGAGINVAGSLRMQSYLLAAQVALPGVDVAEREKQVRAEVAEFETRLASPELATAVGGGELGAAAGGIAAQWHDEIRPLALRSVRDDAARTEFWERIHPFVADIDRFVKALEADLEGRIHVLQVALGAVLFVTLVLVVTAVLVLDVQVFEPVRDLVRCTQAARRHDFAARVQDTGPDELGQLGAAFNHMIEELGGLYGSLDAQIAAKTADLEQKHRTLELLYETTRELARPPLARPVLQRVAESVRRVLGVEGVVICARVPGARCGLPLARAEAIPGSTCDAVQCEVDVGDGTASLVRLDLAHGPAPARIVSIPLLDGERSFGVMPMTLAPARPLTAAQVELAQVIGRHIGAALAAEEARDEHRRLALFEERSVIARELHDSIAQSLSYAKIQLARLSALITGQAPNAQVQDVVDELRVGVSSAYRQLRELLTTFRLQASGKGLRSALAQAVDDLRARTGLEVELRDELVGLELSANEQIHVLQIVREALANVEQHARARHAWVHAARPADAQGLAIEVTVEDDGVGIGSPASPHQHFGLSIMRDRASALHGRLEVGARAPCGTCVRLRFAPLAAATGLSAAVVAEVAGS